MNSIFIILKKKEMYFVFFLTQNQIICKSCSQYWLEDKWCSFFFY